MACLVMLCLSLLFFSFISEAYGSNGCPKSKSLIIRDSYQIVTWDTTWTDYQSKVCKWRLNFQTPEVVNFSLRLEKLAISSHDAFVYSGLGIVRKRFEDKVQVRVCGDGNQTELQMSAIGKELQLMGAALCFVIPHGDYNFGQDIFTTHFINMTISLRKQHYVDRTASTTGSSRRVSNRSPPITPASTSYKTRPSMATVASLAVSTPRSSFSSHAGSDVTHPVRFTSVLSQTLPPLNVLSKQTSVKAPSFTQKSTILFLSSHHFTDNSQLISSQPYSKSVLSNRQSTTNPPSSQFSTMYSLLNHQSKTYFTFTQKSTPSNHNSTNLSSKKPGQITQLTTQSSNNHQTTLLPPKLSTFQNNIPLSYQHPNRATFPNQGLISTNFSTYFSHTRGGSSTPHNTVSITTPLALTLQNIETAFVTRSTVPSHSVEISTSESTSEKNTEEYLIAGIVSGVVLILMMTIIFVVYKFKVTVSDRESSLYGTDYSQPLPWRKNWVITKSFSEIEAERAKPDIQLKPSLPDRPSLKQHPVVSRQSTASTSLDEDNDGVYDNIVAVATHEIFHAMEAPNFKRPERYSDGSEFWDFESLSNNLKMQQIHTNKE